MWLEFIDNIVVLLLILEAMRLAGRYVKAVEVGVGAFACMHLSIEKLASVLKEKTHEDK